MEGDDNYDEFGNYIGPDLDSDSSGDEDYDQSPHQDSSRSNGMGAAHQAAMELQSDDLDGPMMELAVSNPEAAANARAAYLATQNQTIDSNAIVLAEDKQYYPDPSEVYGDDVETLVEEEDAQPLSKPIIAPIKKNISSTMAEDSEQETTYNTNFLASLSSHPQLARNVAVVGHLHSGKTSVLDMLVEQTRLDYQTEWPLDEEKRYTDTRLDEQARGMSIKSCPISLVLPSSVGKSYLFNIMDCPGHVNFCAETTAGLRVSDGAIVVIDACEGVMMQTERVVREAVAHNIPICLVINKMDRLITELKLPPNDAYYKIKYMINRLNEVITESYVGRMNLDKMKAHNRGNGQQQAAEEQERPPVLLDPAAGNVCFASTRDRWMFTLESFAYRVYNKRGRIPKHANSHGKAQRAKETQQEKEQREQRVRSTIQETAPFAKRLWGDWYSHPTTNNISKTPPKATGSKRTFVQYVLEPLWKLYGNVLSSDTKLLQKTLEASLGIRFLHEDLCIDPQPLLRLILRRWMGDPCSLLHSGASGFVDMCINHVPSPIENASYKVQDIYRGARSGGYSDGNNDVSDMTLRALNNCDPNGPLMINAVKMYTMERGGEITAANDGFLTFGRVMSGTVSVGQRVRVLGEHYSEMDDLEDVAHATIESINISQGRHLIELTAASAGTWVLLKGIDKSISYTATVCEVKEDQDGDADMMGDDSSMGQIQPTFLPLDHATSATIRVSLEPRVPSELPKMVSALRMVCKSYPLLRSRVEESGEHVILGTGELHLDSALHDLRTLYTVDAISDEGIEIKLSDPVVSFCETVSEASKFQCTSETPNGQNRISVMAEPLERGLAEDVEAGIVGATRDEKEDQPLDPRRVSKYLRKQHGWDALAVRSIWSFGPDIRGPNVLLDDTLSSDKSTLDTVRGSIVQGFRWGCREGPLCDEPMRSCKFKVVDVTLAAEAIYRGGGQIIPASRRAMYSSFLVAEPRLLEPIYHVEIFTPEDCMEPCKKVLSRRRGHITSTAPKPGTPYHVMHGYVPGMDSFGFETDLRCYTQGQAYVMQTFDHWAIVPGDPLDTSVVLRPLEPSPPLSIARDFMIKTRRRKGLGDSVNAQKYFDDPLLIAKLEEYQNSRLNLDNGSNVVRKY